MFGVGRIWEYTALVGEAGETFDIIDSLFLQIRGLRLAVCRKWCWNPHGHGSCIAQWANVGQDGVGGRLKVFFGGACRD